ncbi:hypothetical protein GCM10010520_47800 [Rhizobium viscosum]|uniref:Uncharacterized protein n=1 Tax=Rhizobium viscosum TaxID=1673 RepID=A0ABR9IRF6_RHIVS|nr:hypothetical protein [Rhizobium viscosum]MBE1505789.1 hypothetical protein [Rhizobium viscosum]
MPTVVLAQAFDWPAQLGKSQSALETTLRQAGRCTTDGFTIPVTVVKMDTYLSDNLFDPVVTSGGVFVPVNGEQDTRSDYDDKRTFSSNKVTSIRCTIGREASVQAYAFEDRIVRIKLTFDRCQAREMQEDKFLTMITGNARKPIMVEKCDGTDLAEKDFDTALYQAIKARNTYGYNRQGNPGMLDFEWSKNMSGEFEIAEFRVMWDIGCFSGTRYEVGRKILPDDRRFRCLIDVDNKDPARWSATAMYEILRPGVFVDTVERRLAAMRVFVDMPAERSAALAIRPELQTMIDGIKAGIAARATAKQTKDNAVSNILGGAN